MASKDLQYVRTGGMSESGYGTGTLEYFKKEKLGNYTVLFVGPWTPGKIRAVGDFCRREKMTFLMDEMVNRLSGELTTGYAPVSAEVIAALKEYEDICDGSLLLCEYGGLMFYWPQSTVAGSRTLPPSASNFSEASANAEARMKESIAYARNNGMKAPFVCIEACGMAAPFLYRAGIDRVDFEVCYTSELELNYSAVKGASLAFGKKHFGVDMAMVWYGGNQHDDLWFHRWRNSLFHAFLRGADPIYAEHGVMDYKALGKAFPTDHEQVKKFRSALAELAAFAKANPRPAGFPEAAVAVMRGRLDGFVGAGQTHLWGQRENEAFRLGSPDDSWKLFERFYRRREWHCRDVWGDADYSGNPPLGQVDVIPHDSPDELLGRYKAIVFLGRNSMDEELYLKLLRYVEQGGQLLMTAAHLDTAEAPGILYHPYKNGDWTDLFGVRLKNTSFGPLPYGVKFKEEPDGTSWHFPLWSPNCDPKFTDGGFLTGDFEAVNAQTLAVASDRFVDRTASGEWPSSLRGVLFAKRHGKGTAVLLNSLEYPGASGVRELYAMLLDSCVQSHHGEWEVECSDRVRFSSWRSRNGWTLFLLNTETNLMQDVLIRLSEKLPLRLTLRPGEIRQLHIPF